MRPDSRKQTRILQIKRIRGIAEIKEIREVLQIQAIQGTLQTQTIKIPASRKLPSLPRNPALPVAVPESVLNVGEVPFPARCAAEACGKTVAYAVAADIRPAMAVMGPEKMQLPERPADTVVVQEATTVKCVAVPAGNPAASAMVKELCQMIVSFAMAEKLVLPVEVQEQSSVWHIETLS